MTKFISFLVISTLAGLLHVYSEVEAVKIGYTIRKQQEEKTLALDRARALNYNIARMKSPHNLERRLEAQRIVLDSPKSWQTIVLTPDGQVKPPAPRQSFEPPFFSRFFVGTAQAEARDQ